MRLSTFADIILNMKFSTLFLSVAAACVLSCGQPSAEYTVLQWNIWQEGTSVPGGYDAIVSELHRLAPDFVTLSEVRNYGGVDFTARLVSDLAALGDTYYTAPSYDSGLLSRYPIERFDTIFPESGDHGSIYRLHATAPSGHRFAVYTAHLDYQDCAYYEPRGYSGVTWEECPVPDSVEEILRKNDLSRRDDAIRQFLDAAAEDIAAGRTVIIGGDFNEPSYLDWTEASASLYDHAGFVVPWTVSVLLSESGFVDAFRSACPDPMENPGFTYPSANPDVDIKRLTWAPESDERERIDCIYFKSPEAAEVAGSWIFGPEESVVRSRTEKDPGDDPRILPLGVWPTDHKGLLIKLKLYGRPLKISSTRI